MSKTHAEMKTEVEQYIDKTLELLQYPFGLDLCVDHKSESMRSKLNVGSCEAALELYTLNEPVLFISKRIVEMFNSEIIEEQFEAEKTICHELVHGLMRNTIEIAFDYIKDSESFKINLERDTDIIAERLANLIRIANRK